MLKCFVTVNSKDIVVSVGMTLYSNDTVLSIRSGNRDNLAYFFIKKTMLQHLLSLLIELVLMRGHNMF